MGFCFRGENENGQRKKTFGTRSNSNISKGDHGSPSSTFRESVRNQFLPATKRHTGDQPGMSSVGEEGEETTQRTFIPLQPRPWMTYSHDHGQTSAEDIIDQQRRHIEDLQHRLKEADDDLQRFRPERKYHISDDYLWVLWDDLRYKIQTHTNQRFTTKPKEWSLDQFCGLTDQAAEYMDNPITRGKLFEAIIWKFLVENVFSLDGLVWSGSAHEHLKYLSCIFLDRVKTRILSREEYNAWRAKSAAMLCLPDRNAEEDGGRITSLSSELNQLLQRSQSYGYNANSRPNISEILVDAVNIDMHMKKSRAEYHVYMYRPIEYRDFSMISDLYTHGFEFNPGTDQENVTTAGGSNRRRVHLVVSPVVLKRGTAEGNLYNHKIVISKRSVLCD